MLQRYCKLIEEMNAISNNQMDRLSTEEIMHYLDLRFEQEKLARQLGEILLETIVRLQELIEQSQGVLYDLPPMTNKLADYPTNNSLDRLARIAGSLEQEMEKVVSGCHLLKEELTFTGYKENQGGDEPPWQQTDPQQDDVVKEVVRPVKLANEQAREQIACAVELVPECPGNNLEPEGEEITEAQKNTAKGKGDNNSDISPSAVKKIENIIRSKSSSTAELDKSSTNEVKGEGKYAVIKIAASGEAKPRNGKKERKRR